MHYHSMLPLFASIHAEQIIQVYAVETDLRWINTSIAAVLIESIYIATEKRNSKRDNA